MTRRVISVKPDTAVGEAVRLMLQRDGFQGHPLGQMLGIGASARDFSA